MNNLIAELEKRSEKLTIDESKIFGQIQKETNKPEKDLLEFASKKHIEDIDSIEKAIKLLSNLNY